MQILYDSHRWYNPGFALGVGKQVTATNISEFGSNPKYITGQSSYLILFHT
jgi:hypothetical protein